MSHADVYIGDARAATLLRDDRDRVTFRYNADFLDNHRDTPVRERSVSWTLLSTSTFRNVAADGGAVPPFFAGLLPEGARLDAAIASTKTSADDHLTLLLSVGADTIGDIRIAPADTAPICVEPPAATWLSPPAVPTTARWSWPGSPMTAPNAGGPTSANPRGPRCPATRTVSVSTRHSTRSRTGKGRASSSQTTTG